MRKSEQKALKKRFNRFNRVAFTAIGMLALAGVLEVVIDRWLVILLTVVSGIIVVTVAIVYYFKLRCQHCDTPIQETPIWSEAPDYCSGCGRKFTD